MGTGFLASMRDMLKAQIGRIVLTLRGIPTFFRDAVFRRLFLNAGKLLTANSIATLLGFVITAIVARALGPKNYGVLALILAYQQTIGKLVSFNASEAIIKFGAEKLQSNEQEGLRQLVKFGFCLDLGSAGVGTLLAMMLVSPVIAMIGWDPSIKPLLMLYSVLILFSWTGTAVGILRLFNRFDLLSYAPIIDTLLKLGGVFWCLSTRQTLLSFVIVYLISSIAASLYQMMASLWVLRKNGVRGVIRQPLSGLSSHLPGIWKFVLSTNINSTIRMLSRETDMLILAGLLAPEELGLYKIAKVFSRPLSLIIDPFYFSLYPELAKLWAAKQRTRFVSLNKRVTLLAGGLGLIIWVCFAAFGKWLILRIVGEAYIESYIIGVIYMMAIVIAICGFSLQPSLLAIGQPGKSLKSNAVATLLYIVLLFPAVKLLGVVGAPVAYVTYYLIWTILMFRYLVIHLSGRSA